MRIKAKIPKTLKDFTLSQMSDTLKLLSQIDPKDPNVTSKDVAEFVSVFTGIDFETLLDADQKDLKQVYYIGLGAFNTRTKKDPPNEIMVNGKTYCRQQFEKGKGKGGWFIDVKTRNHEFVERPEVLLALNYIEKGLVYSQKDKNKYIINPTNERAEIFREHFPPDVFFDLHDFFLTTSEKWKNAFSVYKTSETLKAMKTAKKLTKSIRE